MGFRKINEETMKKVCAADYKPNPSYRINSIRDGCFTLLDDPQKIQQPAREWAERKLGYKLTGVPELKPLDTTQPQTKDTKEESKA